jgi:hypothetical protein
MFTPEMFYGLGVLALAAGLVWGVMQVRRRNRANDPLTDAATREEYDNPQEYQREQAQFRRNVRPS